MPPAPTALHQEAVLAFQNLVKEGQALMVESTCEVAECKDGNIKYCGCLLELVGNLKRYMASLSNLTPDQSDAKFGEARDILTAILSIPSSNGASCGTEAFSAKPIVDKIFSFEENLQTTLDIMNKAEAASLPLSVSA